MGFPQVVKEQALLACRRRCVICGEFKGLKIECHHIVQQADGGDDPFDNCIPLCLDCHAEVRSYNPKHPKGNKYTTTELKALRDTFYAKMAENPQANNSSYSFSAANIIDINVLNKMISVVSSLKEYAEYFHGNSNHPLFYNESLDLAFYRTYEEMKELVQELLQLHSQISLQTQNTTIGNKIAQIKNYVPNGYIETGLGESLHVLVDVFEIFYPEENLLAFSNTCDSLISDIQSIYSNQ